MRIDYTIERPSTLLAASCAPSVSLLPVPAPEAYVPVARLAAALGSASQAHQVQIQAELVRIPVTVDGSNGTSGFVGSNGLAVKRLMDEASGVPPRGRPV
ncbi:hypothetical protein [Actinoplanes sp. NPDC051859]|uniref:hypothetical protein n=1 Tax=Actinoplanes sp. NPDC051859 TaxID=3363909 RepID=UPI00379BA833